MHVKAPKLICTNPIRNQAECMIEACLLSRGGIQREVVLMLAVFYACAYVFICVEACPAIAHVCAVRCMVCCVHVHGNVTIYYYYVNWIL